MGSPRLGPVMTGHSSTAMDPQSAAMMDSIYNANDREIQNFQNQGYKFPNPRLEMLKQRTVPVDIDSMDPEMQQLMGGEAERLMRAKAMYAPRSLGR